MNQTTVKIDLIREYQLPVIGKRWFYRVAQYPVPPEHIYDIEPHKELLDALRSRGVDMFSFIERNFIGASKGKEYGLFNTMETIGLLQFTSFDEWFKSLAHRERNLVKRTLRAGLETRVVEVNEDFIHNVFRIYNETPLRQGRKYSGYGLSSEDLRKKFSRMDDSEVIGAYFEDKLIGFMWLGFGDRAATVISFISFISQRDKAPNNALMAEAVRRCDEKGYKFLTYGNMGYNPGLDHFKKKQHFRMCLSPRFFVPLTSKGQLAVKLNLCQSIEHSFSPTLTRALVPFYNIVNKFLPAHSNASEA